MMAHYGDKIDIRYEPTKPLWKARNRAVEYLLSSDFSHLLFVDSDTAPAIDTLKLLLNQNKDIISALYHGARIEENNIQMFPMVLEKVEEHQYQSKPVSGGLEKADAIGMGCALIKKEVFEKLEKPYYYTSREDLHFCEKAIASGYEIFVDCDAPVKHYHIVPL